MGKDPACPVLQLYEEPILCGKYGWVFSYQSKAYLETGSPTCLLAGNAPILVDRHSHRLFDLGTAYPEEYYVENYLTHGDPHFDRQPAEGWVELTCLTETIDKVAAIRIIRRFNMLGLRDVKQLVEDCLAGKSRELQCASDMDALELAEELDALGVTAKQLLKY